MSCNPNTCQYYHAWTQHIKENTCSDSIYCDAFGLDDDEVIAHMESEHGGTTAKAPAPAPAAKPKPAAVKPRFETKKPAPKATEVPTRQWKKTAEEYKPPRKPTQKPHQVSGPRPTSVIPMDAEVVPFLDYINGCKWVVHQTLRTVTKDGNVRYLIGICGQNTHGKGKFCPECNSVRLALNAKKFASKPTSAETEPEEDYSEQPEDCESD